MVYQGWRGEKGGECEKEMEQESRQVCQQCLSQLSDFTEDFQIIEVEKCI